MQSVGELDQEHAHVVGDRKQKLAQVLRLLGPLRHEIELFELGQPLDQHADVLAELLLDLRARRLGVFDGVVQERRGDRRVVELQIGEDRRDFERVREIRVARGARLRAVRFHRIDEGAIEQFLVRLRIVAANPLDELVLPHHGRVPGL